MTLPVSYSNSNFSSPAFASASAAGTNPSIGGSLFTNLPVNSAVWNTLKKVTKIAVLVLAALALTAFFPFNAYILFASGVMGMMSKDGDWIRSGIHNFTDTFKKNLPQCIVASLVFLAPATITYSFLLGAYVGIDMKHINEA